MSNRKKLYTLFAVVMIIFVYIQVFYFSNMPIYQSEAYSMTVAESLVGMLEKILPLDLPFNDSKEQIRALDSVIRKAAHFSEYALLGILTYSIAVCWKKTHRSGTLLTFAFVVILAAADEIHQYFVPGRFCSIKDVGIDSAGCLTAILVFKLLYGNYIRRRIKAGRIG